MNGLIVNKLKDNSLSHSIMSLKNIPDKIEYISKQNNGKTVCWLVLLLTKWTQQLLSQSVLAVVPWPRQGRIRNVWPDKLAAFIVNIFLLFRIRSRTASMVNIIMLCLGSIMIIQLFAFDKGAVRRVPFTANNISLTVLTKAQRGNNQCYYYKQNMKMKLNRFSKCQAESERNWGLCHRVSA